MYTAEDRRTICREPCGEMRLYFGWRINTRSATRGDGREPIGGLFTCWGESGNRGTAYSIRGESGDSILNSDGEMGKASPDSTDSDQIPSYAVDGNRSMQRAASSTGRSHGYAVQRIGVGGSWLPLDRDPSARRASGGARRGTFRSWGVAGPALKLAISGECSLVGIARISPQISN